MKTRTKQIIANYVLPAIGLVVMLGAGALAWTMREIWPLASGIGGYAACRASAQLLDPRDWGA